MRRNRGVGGGKAAGSDCSTWFITRTDANEARRVACIFGVVQATAQEDTLCPLGAFRCAGLAWVDGSASTSRVSRVGISFRATVELEVTSIVFNARSRTVGGGVGVTVARSNDTFNNSSRIVFLFLRRINFDAMRWTKRNRNAIVRRRDLFFLLEVELAVAVEKRLAQHAIARWIHLNIALGGARTLEAKVLDAWIVEALVLSVRAVELSFKKKVGETRFQEQATGTSCLFTYLRSSKVT